MSRFSSPQDPLFQALNSSLGFDYRLAPYDIEQSMAHARMLASREIISGVDRAEQHLDWRMPGYTHLQRAQPVYLSHHLLAWFWKFRRDSDRFEFCMRATDEMPLGAGALAGVNFLTDRVAVAHELGFGKVAENSIDSV